jgi:hypothetical protein
MCNRELQMYNCIVKKPSMLATDVDKHIVVECTHWLSYHLGGLAALTRSAYFRAPKKQIQRPGTSKYLQVYQQRDSSTLLKTWRQPFTDNPKVDHLFDDHRL